MTPTVWVQGGQGRRPSGLGPSPCMVITGGAGATKKAPFPVP